MSDGVLAQRGRRPTRTRRTTSSGRTTGSTRIRTTISSTSSANSSARQMVRCAATPLGVVVCLMWVLVAPSDEVLIVAERSICKHIMSTPVYGLGPLDLSLCSVQWTPIPSAHGLSLPPGSVVLLGVCRRPVHHAGLQRHHGPTSCCSVGDIFLSPRQSSHRPPWSWRHDVQCIRLGSGRRFRVVRTRRG